MALPASNRSAYTLGLDPRKSSATLNAKIERLRKLTGRSVTKIVREANEEGLRWVQDRALVNLENKMRVNKRPQFDRFRTQTLEGAIHDERFSKADARSIRFLIDNLIKTEVPYYASLEYGDDSQIGRRIPFFFLSSGAGAFSVNKRSAPPSSYTHNQIPDIARVATRKGFHSDRIIGPREHAATGAGSGARFTSLIKRPVPQYRYGRDAGDAFIRANIYEQILDRKIAGSGLAIEGVKFVLSGR